MALSHDAVILLRPPTKTKLPVPLDYRKPKVRFLTRLWNPILTTLPLSRYRKTPGDPQFLLQITHTSKIYTATTSWIDPADKPDPLEVEPRPRTSTITGKVLDIEAETSVHRVSQFEQDETGRNWEVICWGKQGQLEDWMVDDDSGLIGDGSGEARPDWRNCYAVIYYEAVVGEEAGIEVWDSIGRYRRLTDSTVRKIQDAIRAVDDREFARLADKLTELVPHNMKS